MARGGGARLKGDNTKMLACMQKEPDQRRGRKQPLLGQAGLIGVGVGVGVGVGIGVEVRMQGWGGVGVQGGGAGSGCSRGPRQRHLQRHSLRHQDTLRAFPTLQTFQD